MGLVVAGTLSDYRDAERAPTDIAASLYAIMREAEAMNKVWGTPDLVALRERLIAVVTTLRSDINSGNAGSSQGGGITIAAAGLDPHVVAAMPDVPFLCHYRRATEIVDSYPYKEIAEFCHVHRDKVDIVFNTLSYFDGVNFAARAKANTLFSVGLMDQVCPPSTVYAAYNYWAGEKEIAVYPYNGHEGGASFQTVEKLKFLKRIW